MKFIRNGSLLCALGVILGAFGAHGLKSKLSASMLETYQTANHYLFLHAFAIILYGLFCAQTKRETKFWPGHLFLLGIMLFSGSLYLIIFTGDHTYGLITPFGGLSLIMAWIGFALQTRKHF